MSLGRIMRRGKEETIRAVMEWKPKGKRPRGRPRKMRFDVVEEDLKALTVQEWKEVFQDGVR